MITQESGAGNNRNSQFLFWGCSGVGWVGGGVYQQAGEGHSGCSVLQEKKYPSDIPFPMLIGSPKCPSGKPDTPPPPSTVLLLVKTKKGSRVEDRNGVFDAGFPRGVYVQWLREPFP